MLTGQVVEVNGMWTVRIIGCNRESYTPCQSHEQAMQLLYSTQAKPEIAEVLHWCRESA